MSTSSSNRESSASTLPRDSVKGSIATPTPGSRVLIRRGDFGGEVGTVGSIVAPESAQMAGRTVPIVFNPAAIFDGVHVMLAYVRPEDVQPVPTELEDAPAQCDTVDPWAPIIASWLKTLEGEGFLAAGLTTGEIIEYGLEVEDGFTQQVRVAAVMRSLGYEKVERSIGNSRVWHWVPVIGRMQHGVIDGIPRQVTPHVVNKDKPLGLVVALAALISWLLDKAANVDRLAELAESILDAPQFKLRQHNTAYFLWARQGASILRRLRLEMQERGIATPAEFFSMVKVEPFTDAEPRTHTVNGWIQALVMMADAGRFLAAEHHQGRKIAADGNGDALAAECEAHAEALEWIVKALGGPPQPDDALVVPMLDLVEYVDAAIMMTIQQHDTERPPSDPLPVELPS